MNGDNHDTPPPDGHGAAGPATAAKRSLDAGAGGGGGNAGKKADRSKRIRVSRACDQCRAGREKCDGSAPTCNTCEAQSRSCSYNEPARKRGIQPNYIRTLELILAWLLQQNPDSESDLSRHLPNLRDEVHQAIAFKDVAASEALHQQWRNGIICRQIDQLLSGAEIELPASSSAQQRSQTAGRDTGNIAASYQSPPLSAPSDSNFRGEHAEPVDGVTASPHAVNLITGSSGNEIVKLPTRAWNLLEHYFAFTQTWMPITEKHDILKLMYTYPSDGNGMLAPEHAELWSIMAWSASQMGDQAGTVEANRCRAMAQSLIPERGGFQLSHVKALLVLGLIDMASSSWAAAWLTIGSAVRLLTYLTAGISLETVLSSGRTKHAYLAAFLLESTVSAQVDAITHLRPETAQTIGPLVEDGIEEWSPWSDPSELHAGSSKAPARSVSTFNALVRMALQFRGQAADDAALLENDKRLDIVLKLLQNASGNAPRENPASLLSRHRASTLEPTRNSPTNFHARAQSTHLDHWEAHSSVPQTGQLLNQQYPFMSIPNEGPESLTGSTPVQAAGLTPSLWPHQAGESSLNDTFASSSSTNNNYTSADVFEQLAMLDRTETQNPQFMQNLGFGADLDLMEFFGEDYLPSESLMTTFAHAHAQPGASFSDEAPHGFVTGNTADEAG